MKHLTTVLLLLLWTFAAAPTWADNSRAVHAAQGTLMRESVRFCKEYKNAMDNDCSTDDVYLNVNLEAQYEAFQREYAHKKENRRYYLPSGPCQSSSRHASSRRGRRYYSTSVPYDASSVSRWIRNYVYDPSMVMEAVKQAKIEGPDVKEVSEALQKQLKSIMSKY